MLATVLNALMAAVVTTLVFIGMHLPARGSIVFGLEMLSAGCFFAAAAGLAAQLTPSARGANAIAGVVLGFSYVLRLGADAAGLGWARWLSPEGWGHLMQPFGGNRAWVAIVPLALAIVLAGAAFALRERRDFGAGILAERVGPPSSNRLRTPLALAWRLHRNSVIVWLLSFAALSVLLGAVAAGMPALTQGAAGAARDVFRHFGNGGPNGILDAFLWLMSLILGYVVSLLGVLAVLRLRTEETSGNAELVLSTSASRVRWVTSHVVVALVAPAVILAISGLVIGSIHGAAMHDTGRQITRVLAASLLQVPAVWTLVGVTTFAFGWFPRQSAAIGWATFAYVNLFGEVLGSGMGLYFDRANKIIPFHHLPKILSGEPFRIAPIAAMLAITLALIAGGLVGFRRRDVG
jgi:ABC-2 type transport system permease protein